MGRSKVLAGQAWTVILAVAAVLACPAVRGQQGTDSITAHDDPATVCPLDGDALGVPIVELDEAHLDSLLESAARHNEAQLTRLDSLFEAGIFGKPGLPNTRRAVHLMSKISTLNCYRYLGLLASDTTCVYQTSEPTLEAVFARYSDASLLCAARLRRVRFGLGHVCLHYDLREKVSGHTFLGENRVAYRIKDVDLEGKRRRMLSLDLPTGSAETVEVLLADHYTFDFEYTRSAGPPAPYEWFLVKNIRGGWLHKWGMHHPTAFMFWTTPLESLTTGLPETPLVGVRIYIPNLELKLPFILPDIDFDDLREVELPEPLLHLEYLRAHRYPSWIHVDRQLEFTDWMGAGPLPALIRERFPH